MDNEAITRGQTVVDCGMGRGRTMVATLGIFWTRHTKTGCIVIVSEILRLDCKEIDTKQNGESMSKLIN